MPSVPLPLQRHLLTRSDLARMAVPATEVFRWLAEGVIEQIGVLPDEEVPGDPVFTVRTEELRSELRERLRTLGKATVVLTPLGVRSFLLRTMLLVSHTAATASAAVAIAGGEPDAPLDPVHEHLRESDLAEVLQEAAGEVIGDADAVLRLAEEAAQHEQINLANAVPDPVERPGAPDRAPRSDAGGAGGADCLADEETAPDDEPCFDIDDLTSELGEWAAAPPPHQRPATEAAMDEQRDAAPAPHTVPGEQPAHDSTGHGASASAAPAVAGVDRTATAQTVPEFELDGETELAKELAMDPAEHGAAGVATQSEDDAVVHGDEVELPADDELAPARRTVAEEASDADVEAAAEPPPAAPVGCLFGDDDEAGPPPERPVKNHPTISSALDNLFGERSYEPPSSDECAVPVEQDAGDAGCLQEEHAELAADHALLEVHQALHELAQREQAPPFDLAPLVAAVHEGFARVTEAAAGTGARLAALEDRLGAVGDRVVQGVGELRDAFASTPERVAGSPMFVAAPRGDRVPQVVFAVAVLTLAWSLVFWLRVGSPRLAVGTLVGVNAVVCALLLARRDRA